MAQGRGLYGQQQADSHNTATAVFSERLADNEVSEGEVVARLRNILTNGSPKRFDAASKYMEKLRVDGFSDARIRSIYARASAGVRF